MDEHHVNDVAKTALQLVVALMKHLESRKLMNNTELQAILKERFEVNEREGNAGVNALLLSMIQKPQG